MYKAKGINKSKCGTTVCKIEQIFATIKRAKQYLRKKKQEDFSPNWPVGYHTHKSIRKVKKIKNLKTEDWDICK